MNQKDIDRFNSKYKIMDNDCWEWQYKLTTKGYGRFRFNNKTYRAHRISYEIHNGAIPSGMHVLHKCDNRKCVNPDHLFIGTNDDNVKDKLSKNRQCKGINQGLSKLTEQQVLEIRNSNESQVTLAKKYNVTQSLICFVKNRKIWTHI